MGNQNWRTPPEFFAGLDQEFHFTLDAAASHEDHLCKRYCTQDGTWDGMYDISPNDGLDYNWAKHSVWCNPPYGNVEPWVKKARDSAISGALVVMLLAPAVDTKWFHKYVWDHRLHRPRGDVEVRFLQGRIRFIHPDPEKRVTDFKGFRPISGNMVVVFHPSENPPTQGCDEQIPA